MRLKLSLLNRRATPDTPVVSDILVAADVTVTVGEIAARILGNDALPRDATLRVQYPSATGFVVLDPFAPLPQAHLCAGSYIEAVPVGVVGPAEQRAFTVRAALRDAAGNVWPLVEGHNQLGRDKRFRIWLRSRTVSRKHADIFITGDRALLTDLGAANPVSVGGVPVSVGELAQGDVLEIGDQDLTFTWMLTPAAPQVPETIIEYVRPPRIEQFVGQRRISLPTPPAAPAPQHLPMLAILAPLLMGVASYAMTQSPYSLILIAMSPLMMLGSWLDGIFGNKKDFKRQLAEYHEGLVRMDEELTGQQQRECLARNAEFPDGNAIASAILHRDVLLWTRRPEHATFLELRVGLGADRSRLQLELPERGNIPDSIWQQLTGLQQRHETIEPVPLLISLPEAGSMGIVGERNARDDVMRQIILQLATLHAPSEMVIAGAAAEAMAPTWAWLKWLPHVDPPQSPLGGAHLAMGRVDNNRLIARLEELIARRQSNGDAGALRSHLPVDHRVGDDHGIPVTSLPRLPAVVVLIVGETGVDTGRLVQLAEDGPDVGVYTVWLQDTRTQLPAACRSFVDIALDLTATLNQVREAVSLPLRQPDRVGLIAAERMARELASIDDAGARVLDDSDLPSRVALHELVPYDIVGSAQGVVAAWRESDSIKRTWATHQERKPGTLPAVVGMGLDGRLRLDLREQGPHALVGGTTGAGKSEFLQTWIMSMAASISPDRLTFLLVDYKGGAAFAECVNLPHTVGLVTDLSPHLVQRALTSLRAELTYREHLLNAHGAKDLIMMERSGDKLAPPNLIIVIDEFAALAADVPEFVDGVVDVAARGRSLGVHLIMATQRPNGVITDNLRANTNLRVALRMADESDSADVIDTDLAAHFDPATPGRGAVRVGPGRISGFQTAYIGAPVQTRESQADLAISDLPFGPGNQWPQPAAPTQHPGGAREIQDILEHIQAAASELALAAPRRPWLDELPDILDLESVWAPNQQVPLSWPLGVQDEPAQQRQTTLTFVPERDGHLCVVGSAASGKSTLLRTVAAVATHTASPEAPLWIYGIASGSGLAALGKLPNVGDILDVEDHERIPRLLKWLVRLAKQRTSECASANVATHSEWLTQHPLSAREQPKAAPDIMRRARIVVLIDGYGALQERFENDRQFDFERAFDDLLSFGPKVGIHVIVAVDRIRSIPQRFRGYLGSEILLKVTEDEATAAGIPAGFFADAPAGRGMYRGREIQVAIPAAGTTAGQVNAAVGALAAEWRAVFAAVEGVEPDQWQAPAVRLLPERIALKQLAARTQDGRVVVAMADDDFGSVGYSMRGVTVFMGRSKSGTSTALRTAVAAYERQPDIARKARRVLWLTKDDETSVAPGHVNQVVGDDAVANVLARLLSGGKSVSTEFGQNSVPSQGLSTASSGMSAGASGSTLDGLDFSIPHAGADDAMPSEPAADTVTSTAAPRSDVESSGADADETAILAAREAAVAAALERLWATEPETPTPPQDTIGDWSIPSAVTGVSSGANAVFADLPIGSAGDDTSTDPDDASRTRQDVPGLIVIERITDFIGGVAERQLEAFLSQAARSRWNVVVEADATLIAASWDLQSAVRSAKTSFLLRPEEGDGYSALRVTLPEEDYSEFPPGRGYMVADGQVRKVQIAQA